LTDQGCAPAAPLDSNSDSDLPQSFPVDSLRTAIEAAAIQLATAADTLPHGRQKTKAGQSLRHILDYLEYEVLGLELAELADARGVQAAAIARSVAKGAKLVIGMRVPAGPRGLAEGSD
jgi:hypothetical protein